jgi:hypothetical protein
MPRETPSGKSAARGPPRTRYRTGFSLPRGGRKFGTGVKIAAAAVRFDPVDRFTQ